MPADRRAVVAAGAAIALPAVAADIGEDLFAIGRRASAQPVHAAPGQMQGGADADQGGEQFGEVDIVGSVVQMPAVGVVVEPRMMGMLRQQEIERLGPVAFGGGIDDRRPVLEEIGDSGQVAAAYPLAEDQVRIPAAFGQLDRRPRWVIGEFGGQSDRCLTVRVEMHKPITAEWVG